MENNKDYLCTYKFYDEKGRRLSIFAKKMEGPGLEIKVFTCSRRDDFSKKKSREAYEKDSEGFNPEVLSIILEDGKPKATFLKWCNINYKRLDLIETRIHVEEGKAKVISVRIVGKRAIFKILR